MCGKVKERGDGESRGKQIQEGCWEIVKGKKELSRGEMIKGKTCIHTCWGYTAKNIYETLILSFPREGESVAQDHSTHL